MAATSTLHVPYLRETRTSKQLIVDGEPFLILGCELQNSSFSSVVYMREVWTKLRQTHLNTISASISWEQIEPYEGFFHFDELDQLLTDARSHGLRLVLLWFGSFKNGMINQNDHSAMTYDRRQDSRLIHRLGLSRTPIDFHAPSCGKTMVAWKLQMSYLYSVRKRKMQMRKPSKR